MLAAVNSKSRKYDPLKYMARGAELRRRAGADAAERRVMTGDEALARLKGMGLVIDKRNQTGVAANGGI